MSEELEKTIDMNMPIDTSQGKNCNNGTSESKTIENTNESASGLEETKPAEKTNEQESKSGLTAEEVSSIIQEEVKNLKDQISGLEQSIQKVTAICKDSLDYCQRYERNTVSVLQEENKKKDKYITGILLIDLLKPIAEVCSKIERRIKKCTNDADKKFLTDLLDDITDVATDDYSVEISKTEPGQCRPENISKVDDTILTNDEALKGKVAESLCSSWVLNGRIIQKERVIVYKYEPLSAVSEAEETKEVKEINEPAENGSRFGRSCQHSACIPRPDASSAGSGRVYST